MRFTMIIILNVIRKIVEHCQKMSIKNVNAYKEPNDCGLLKSTFYVKALDVPQNFLICGAGENAAARKDKHVHMVA